MLIYGCGTCRPGAVTMKILCYLLSMTAALASVVVFNSNPTLVIAPPRATSTRMLASGRTVVTSLTATVTRLLCIDSKSQSSSSGEADTVLIGTEKGLVTVRQNSTTSFEKRSFYDKNHVAGNVEAVAYLQKINSIFGSNPMVVVANSRESSTSPKGAIQLVREVKQKNKNKTSVPKVFTLISAVTALKGPTLTMMSVNGRDVKVVDMNGDGYMDIVATVSGKDSSTNSDKDNIGFLLLLLNDGSNHFNTSTTKIVLAEDLDGKALFDVGDIDQNGKLDIAVLGIDSKIVTVFYQETDNSFTPQVVEKNVESNYAIHVGMFNKDTGADIFTIGPTRITAYLPVTDPTGGNGLNGFYYRGFSRNRMFNFDPSFHLSNDYRDWQIRVNDIDGDGLVDVVMVYGKQTGLKWMKQLDNKIMAGPANLISDIGGPDAFDIVDMNHDGVHDIVIHSSLDDAVYLYAGQRN